MLKQVAVLFCLSIVFSCNRMKREGKELVNKVERKSEEASDKMFPHFDAYKPDTKYNKLRFMDFLKVSITPDVKNIYCHDDAIGIDSDFQFSFNCSQQTADKIIETNALKVDLLTTDFAFGLQDDFKWWNKKKIGKLQLYSWKGEHQYFKYFWYDKEENKGYYFDFDM